MVADWGLAVTRQPLATQQGVKIRLTRWGIWAIWQQPLLQKRVTSNVNVRLVDLGKDLDGLDEGLQQGLRNPLAFSRLWRPLGGRSTRSSIGNHNSRGRNWTGATPRG